MAHLQVTCITKRPAHYDPHERIQVLDGRSWYKTEDDVIRDIERGANSYYVSVAGRHAQVVVALHRGRKYVKTTADGYAPDSLSLEIGRARAPISWFPGIVVLRTPGDIGGDGVKRRRPTPRTSLG